MTDARWDGCVDMSLRIKLRYDLITIEAPMSGIPKPSDTSEEDRATIVFLSIDLVLYVSPNALNAPFARIVRKLSIVLGGGVRELRLCSMDAIMLCVDLVYSRNDDVTWLALHDAAKSLFVRLVNSGSSRFSGLILIPRCFVESFIGLPFSSVSSSRVVLSLSDMCPVVSSVSTRSVV